jgi:hypothetical protein
MDEEARTRFLIALVHTHSLTLGIKEARKRIPPFAIHREQLMLLLFI